MYSLIEKLQVHGERREQMLEQYLKRSLASLKYGIAGSCLLAYYELDKHTNALVLTWLFVLLALNGINYFFATNVLKNPLAKLTNQICLGQFVLGLLQIAVWLSFLFIFKQGEDSVFQVLWSGAIIFIVLIFYMNALSYSIIAVIVYPLIEMLVMFVYLYGFTSITDSAILLQMGVALCLGMVCVLMYGLSSYQLNLEVSEVIIKSKHLIAQMDELLIHDNLTNLYNRRYFDEQLVKYVELYKRSEQPFCVAIMDIDFFKKVNDAHGHSAGDELLVALSGHIKSIIRVSDLFARYGGEEFAMIMSLSRLEDAQKVLDNIRDCVENQSYSANEIVLSMTVSIGVTEISKDDSAKTLLARADKALYQAKAQGRNRVIGLDAAIQQQETLGS
jgi:diguanylate cyclase (GGDEF)-like protein